MLCRNPYVKGKHAYPCGRCLPCRLNNRRTWTQRIILEAGLYEDNAFLTLTYSDEFLPHSLNPKHVQDFLKRLRFAIAPLRIRYFAVGEYGDESNRPHYHIVVFGLPPCERGSSRFDRRTDRCCSICNLVRATWGLGNVFVGTVSNASAQYVAGYTVKKLTDARDPLLNGRHPEFARMSLRPGIGADALHEIASELMRLGLDISQPDVPSALRHGSKILPLGRYLRRRLRTLIGKAPNAPPETLAALTEALRPLYEATHSHKGFPELKTVAFKNALIDQEAQKVASMEARSKIFKQKRTV